MSEHVLRCHYDALQQKLARADARIAELEAALKRQAAAARMLDMSHVARAETMMQHAQVLHDQSNTAALESERQANAMLTERVAELEAALSSLLDAAHDVDLGEAFPISVGAAIAALSGARAGNGESGDAV